jgi:hypothetical protein
LPEYKTELYTAFHYSINPEKNYIKKAKFAVEELTGLFGNCHIEIE